MSNIFKLPLFEVSSKTNVNIDKLLYTMILKITENRAQSKTKQDFQPSKDLIVVEKLPSDDEISKKESSKCC